MQLGNPIRFIVDAQLPKKLSDFIKDRGYDSVHTLELPDKNATTDRNIRDIAYIENRILITKDDDFLRSFLISKKPAKLILIKTGNIINNELLEIFQRNFSIIISLVQKHAMLEITKEEIIAHN